MRSQALYKRSRNGIGCSIRLRAAWLLVLGLLAGSVGAVPTFSPDPSFVELAPGQTLTVSITPGPEETLTNVFWAQGSGAATYTATGGAAVLTVPDSSQHCSTIQDTIVVEYDTCGDGCIETSSASVLVAVVDPLQVSPTSGNITGEPGSTQTLPLQVLGGVAPYSVASSLGAVVGLSGGTLSYAIPADATADYTDTVIVSGTEVTECGGNSASVAISVAIQVPLIPTATIVASDPDASKEALDPGEFTIRLSDPAPSSGIQVSYGVGGTAVAGEDYQGLPGSAFIAAGQTSVAIAVTPLAGTSLDATTVVATLEAGSGYEVGEPASATVAIAGAAVRPTATIVASDPDASKEGLDPGEFTIRLSDPAPSSGIQVSYGVGGTAVAGEDYQALSGIVAFAPGQSSESVAVIPLSGPPTGSGTVIATLLPDDGYAVGEPASATVTIADRVVALLPLSGDGQLGLAGKPLQPFVVTATSGGSPVAGVPILWTLVSGDGALSSDRSITGVDGRASSTLTPSRDGEFAVRAQVEGTSESVTFSAVLNSLASLPGLTGPQRSMATALDTLCPRLSAIAGQRSLTSGEQDLLVQCRVLISSSVTDPGAAAEGIAALTPEQASAPRKLTTRITGAQLENIAARLTALRRGARGISLRNLTFQSDGQGVNSGALSGLFDQVMETGGGASADDTYEFERLGIFISGNVDWGSKDRSANEDGYDFNTLGLTAGVDYRFAEGLVLGLALGYGDTDVDIDRNGGDLGGKAWSSTFYGTYYATDHFYVEGSATYGRGDFDQTRNISYSLLGASREATADFTGTQYAYMIGGGFDFIRETGILDVYGRLRYIQADLDGYREQGASGLDLNIGDQESKSLTSVLGLNYTRSISTARAVLVPQVWFEWLHEFDGGDDEVTGFFANDPSRIVFDLATDRFDADYFRLGLGLGAQFGQGRTLFLSYEAAAGLSDYTEQTVNAGMRLEF
jgi:outer membrane autotransporter protein